MDSDAAEFGLSGEERLELNELAQRSLGQEAPAPQPDAGGPGGARPIRGFDLSRPFRLDDFIASLASTGFQASAMGEAIAILRESREAGAPLYLGITSNIGTSGLRDQIAWLVRHRHLRGLAATAGAIEEDVMKVAAPFLLGDFDADDAALHASAINRTGNIFIPGDRYGWLHTVLWTLHRRLARSPGFEVTGVVEYVRELGHQLALLDVPRRDESFVFQAWQNGLPIYCPALLDGAIGDAFYFARKKNPRLALDMSRCHEQLIDEMVAARGDGPGVSLLAVGGSVPKHMLCNAAIYSGGARWAVYVNTADEHDGSNAGATPSEAVSWGKVQATARTAKVHAEATLVLPLMLAAVFQR